VPARGCALQIRGLSLATQAADKDHAAGGRGTTLGAPKQQQTRSHGRAPVAARSIPQSLGQSRAGAGTRGQASGGRCFL
jgi:hypothetical protein